MNNNFDDFSNAINNIEVNREKNKFKLNQLKIEHYHWNSGDIDAGMPVSTSIELVCNYNFEKEKLEWKKIISHTYLDLNNYRKHVTATYEEDIANPDELIAEIEKYDLRELNNNYFTEQSPESFTHWEISYNYYFKIVGTYDQRINEFEAISNLLNFKKTISNEVRKIQEKVRNL